MDVAAAFNSVAMLFYNNNAFFFYYTIASFLFLLLFLALSARDAIGAVGKVKRRDLLILAAIVFAFAAVEIAFVPLTIHLFSDEYIYMSMGKTMLYDHVAGICSFSNATNCVPGTFGLFQQPVGWPLMIAITYLASGVSLYGAMDAALVLSAISIVLVFLISMMFFGDARISLIAAGLFAATPLFLTYSRTAVSDTPMLAFLLLSVFLSLVYMKTRRMAVGVAAAAAVLYTMLVRVDGFVVIFAVFGCVVPYFGILQRKGKKTRIKLAKLAVIFMIIALPQFFFIYNTNRANNFGDATGNKISLGSLASNLPQNANFFLGSYAYLMDSVGRGYEYNIEYPLVYTLLAVLGVALLLYKRRFREAFALLVWFFGMFLFYSSYYAGGALFSVGIDIRYFLGIFPVVAILASYGLVGIWNAISSLRGGPGKARGVKPAEILMVLLLLLAFAGPVVYFVNIVTLPPQNIYAFAAEREGQTFALETYNSIPKDCFVLTYTPTMWYILNRSNMYAGWMNIRSYRSTLLNDSNGCVYFEYDLDCQKYNTNPQYDNSQTSCGQLMKNFTMQAVATERYNNFGWNLTLVMYKLVSYSNGTALR